MTGEAEPWWAINIQGDITLAAAVQAGAAIIGFIVVIYQLIQVGRSLQGATQDRLYAHYTEICKLFVGKPELRPFFYDREPRPKSDDPDAIKLKQEIDFMSETILGLIEHSVLQHKNLPKDAWLNCWKPYAAERIRKSVELRKFFLDNIDYYAYAMREPMKDLISIAESEQVASSK